MVDRKEELTGYMYVFAAVLSWSFSEILQKKLQDTVPPMSKSFLRFFIGIIPLMIILFLYKDFKLKQLFLRNWKSYLIAGIIGCGIGNFIYFAGIVHTQANIGSVIYGTYPLFISFYSIFILNERDNLKRKFLGYFIGIFAVIGLATQFTFQGFFASENLMGNGLVLLGSIAVSIFQVYGKKVTNLEKDRVSNLPLKSNVIIMFFAGLTDIILIIFMPEERSTLFNYPARSWGYLIILGVFTTGLGTWAFFIGTKHIDVSKGISLAMFKPLLATIFAFFILDEMVPWELYICMPLVIIAVYLITQNKHTEDVTDIKIEGKTISESHP